MKITSFNRSAGRRAKEKAHHYNDAPSVGHQRDGETFQRIPNLVSLHLYFDGRAYLIEMDNSQAMKLADNLRDTVRGNR